MKVKRDFNAHIALVVLILGSVCTILALSTNYWFEVKEDSDLSKSGINLFLNTTKVKSRTYFGLWQICSAIDGPTVGASKCFKISTLSKEELSKFAMSAFGMMYQNQSTSGMDLNQFGSDDLNNEIPNNNGNGNIDSNPFQSFGESSANDGSSYDYPLDGMEDFDDENAEDDNQDNALPDFYNPDYLKAIQAFEILALITGVATITVWLVYIFTSAMKRKGVASNVYKLVAIVFTIITAVSHFISVITWASEKEKEKSDATSALRVAGADKWLEVTWSYGWSWGMAIAAAVLHLLVVVPVALTKPNNPDDGMEHSLYPRTESS